MYGVMGGSLEVCKCLVQSGADASISDKVRRTQLHCFSHY